MGGKHVNLDSNFQPRKCAKRHHSDDGISQLPDEILVIVLSLLSLKEAARTSVLSTRWINLWKHTSCLDFEAKISLDKIAEHIKLRKKERRKYVRWVNSVIESHKGGSTLKDFKICFDLDKHAQEEITKWLEFACTRQVERLELELLEYGDFMKIPSKMYAFPEHLLLVNNLKSLKALCLKYVDLTDEAVHFFLRNSQFLEQLVVIGADKITNLEVCGSSLGLKHLEIRSCFRLKSIKVSAPNLTTLIVSVVEGLLLENVPMLKEVHFSCGYLCTYKLVPALLCCIQQLEILYLWLNIPEEEMEQCKFPKLPKLKKLFIYNSEVGNESLMVLSSFLRVSPYLREFVIEVDDEESEDEENEDEENEENEDEENEENEDEEIEENEDEEIEENEELEENEENENEENRQLKSVGLLHHHLKVFTFEGYIGRRSDDEFVKFILENCVMIEKIIIDPRKTKMHNRTTNKPYHTVYKPNVLEKKILEEETARNDAKQQLQGLVPQHVKFLIL